MSDTQWIVRRLNEMCDYHIYLADKVVLTEAAHQLQKIFGTPALPPTITPEARAEMVELMLSASTTYDYEEAMKAALDALIAAEKVRV